jgi:gliding motility-associated-like protein
VNDSLGCSELLVQFMDQTATVNGSTYNWDFGDNSTSQLLNPSNLYTTNGSYTIKEIVTSPEGCTDSIIKSNLISMQSQPSTTISASNYAMVLPKSIIDFKSQSQNYTELLWNFGDFNFSSLENPSHDFLDTGKFTVCLSVFSSFGCKDTACLEVKISASNAIAVPSAFTPNGDGNNDEFLIKGGPFLEIEMKIMNEWGNLLFTSSSQNIGWNGKYDNTDQAIGLYEYIITGKTLNNEDINLYGVLNLTR